MQLDDALHDRDLASRLVEGINTGAAALDREIRIMEVCGTHTVSLRKEGVHSLLPESVRLISGPGCPVCVTPTGYIDNALLLAEDRGAVIATFGDMLKVPGSAGYSLSRYLGSSRVRMVYSPSELPGLAAETQGPVVFLGIGFETTIPAVASVFLRSHQDNLYLYPAFKTVVPALRALLSSPDNRIDGFLLPGHVSVIIGADAYGLLEGVVPGAIAGFEPIDMLHGILAIVQQLVQGQSTVQNTYPRAVKANGNPKALSVMEKLLTPSDDLWRGLGVIPGGGLGLRGPYQGMDAARVFSLPPIKDYDPPGCLCGRVIQGKSTPADCTLFGTRCTPDHPVGPCMVSSEGTCSAHFRFS
jgi:hydrogenase expression/formation protein HypD